MSQRKESAYFDEEDLLGYKIWVAELELLVSQQKQRTSKAPGKVDFGACYALLQKLHATIDDTGADEIKEHQRRCEDALVDILLKGCPPPIRRLVCSSLSKLYGKGDQLPLFSRVSSLQLFLGTREAFGSQTSEDIRLGAVELMNTLYYSHGKSLTVGVLETCLIACKYCSRSCSTTTRQAGLKLLAATVEGVGFQHREATQVQSTALKCIEKIAKEKDLGGDYVKLGISDVLRAISVVVPLESWVDGALSLESARNLCLSGLKDFSSYVRTAYSRALGELVASIYQGSLDVPDENAKGKALATDVIESCLVAPLAENLISEDRKTSIALCQAWVHFLSRVKGPDDGHLVHLAKGPLVSIRVAGITSAIERGPCGPDLGLGSSIATGERPFSQACGIFIVRCGIIENMGEHGQKELLRNLCQNLLHSSEDFPPSLIITHLELMTNIIETLGETGSEIACSVEQVLEQCFTNASTSVRLHAGQTIVALSTAEPGRSAGLFKFSLGSLKDAADALVESSNMVSDKTRCTQGTPRWPGSNKFGREIDHLHGWSVACACLNAAVPDLPLGIPSSYVKICSQIAAALIESPRSDHPGGIRAELEAGYILLGSLCKYAEKSLQSIYKSSLLKLWIPMFSEDSMKHLQEILDRNDDQEISSELWWRSEALQALGAHLNQNMLHEGEKRSLYAFLVSFVEILDKNRLLASPTSSPCRGIYSQAQAASAILQVRLFRILLMINSLDNKSSMILSCICIQGMQNTGLSFLSVAGLQGFLRRVVGIEDWTMRESFFSNDIFERDLVMFSGASGAAENKFWSLGASYTQTYSQSESLSEALLLVRTQLVSKILEIDGIRNDTVQKLMEIPSIVKKDKTGAKKLCLSLLAAAPFILVAKTVDKCTSFCDNDISMVENLASGIALYSSHGVWVQSIASNLFFAVCRLSSVQHSQRLLSMECSRATDTPSLDQRITHVLSIGNISRAIGGICMTSMLDQVVQTLLALARASPSSIFSCIAYSLAMASLSSGPGFLDFVEDTLAVTHDILLDESIYSIPGLLPSIGQLGNAMVACLGPDYVLGSTSYNICRSIVSEMRVSDVSCVRLKEDILSGALQSVLYIQMLVLFVPRASKTLNHITFLLETLPARQPNLRRAAADTLRHLAEKETDRVLEQNIQGSLLAAYDQETDAMTAHQLRGSLDVLLRQGAPRHPYQWISLLGSIATCSGATKNQSPLDSNVAVSEGKDEFDDAWNGAVIQNQASICHFHPRLRTRLVAANGLILIPKLATKSCANDRDRTGLAKEPGDPLVSCVNVLVDTGFKMALGEVDILRSKGVTLLLETLNVLGYSKDPLMPDELLMHQFQAQYVSALRASLSKDASPSLHVAGCALVASFLEKGIIASDNRLMEKILGLLCEPLTLWSSGLLDPTQASYAEWVAAGARAALLESHAICATMHLDSDSLHGRQYSDIVARAHGPFYTILVECWTGLLEDTFALVQNDESVNERYTLRLYGRLGSSKSPTLCQARRGVSKIIQRGWPSILDAASFVMSRDRTVSHGDSGRSRHSSLFDITIGCLSIEYHHNSAQTILKALERLTRPKSNHEIWLTPAMMTRAVITTRHIMESSSNSDSQLCEISAQVIQNLVYYSSSRRELAPINVWMHWVIDYTMLANALPFLCLENSLYSLRLAFSNLVTQGAALEDLSLCLYQILKCGFEISKENESAKVASLACAHVLQAAKEATTKASALFASSAMDPGVPSMIEILTLAASEACDQIASANEMHVEYLVHTILGLGGLVTHVQGGDMFHPGAPPKTPCQEKCLQSIATLLASDHQNAVFKGVERWMDDHPIDPWVKHCGEVLCPFAVRQLYEYSLGMSCVSTSMQAVMRILRFFSAVDNDLGRVCMRSIVPVMVRIAGNTNETNISTSCVECLLGLAKGPSSTPMFKIIVSKLPEHYRVSLASVLASGGPSKVISESYGSSSDRGNRDLVKGLQTLDLSRFT